MSAWADVVGAALTGVSGGLVGFIGSIAKGWLDYKLYTAKADHEFKMAELDMKAEAAAHAHEVAIADKQIQRAEVEGQLAAEVAAQNAFAASMQANRVKYGGWVDQVRGLMRPILTTHWSWALTLLTAIVWYDVDGMKALEAKQKVELFLILLNAVVFSSTTALGWWFGSRPTLKQLESR